MAEQWFQDIILPRNFGKIEIGKIGRIPGAERAFLPRLLSQHL